MALRYEQLQPTDLNAADWRQLQTVSRAAFSVELKHRTPDEIDNLTLWNDPERYYDSHIDPNSEVGKHFSTDQSFTVPRVCLAFDGDEKIGFGYAAHNVSGSNPLVRAAKLAGWTHKYYWIREVAVHPEYMRYGIGTRILNGLLMSANLNQPSSAYVWPDEIPFLQNKLEQVGFEPKEDKPAMIYGPGSEPVREIRMVAQHVASSIMNHLGKNLE
ncbi:MAG TPA: GNAT family N-acetyltransferase [Candidatus Saccharimonadales bacterium]|nr:GNAT family N-acetyltransferase [Candidatus Saccharimonadales bacterium]